MSEMTNSAQDEQDEQTETVRHRMLPGSHERRYGPECACGAGWDWWADECTRGEG